MIARALAGLCLLPLLACQTLDDGRVSTLKPSALDQDFKDLDDAKKNPFGKRGTKVDFVVTGVRNYDAFFKEAAEMKGVVVLGEHVLRETDAYVARIKKSGGRSALGQKGQQEFLRQQTRLTTITRLLTEVPERSSALTKTGQKLATDAPQTFAGPQAFKLPGVVKGLQVAKDDLTSAATRAPGLGKKLVDSSAALVGL